MRVIEDICNIQFIKDYLNHFHISKIDTKNDISHFQKSY